MFLGVIVMKNCVVVTGGSRGIGAAISSLFAVNGFNVIVNYNRSEKDAKKLCDTLLGQGFSAIPFKADISKPIEAERLVKFAVEKFGNIDVLINNAGISQQKLLTDITDVDWNKMISTNVSGAFYCSRAAAKYMINKKNGSIINISSMWGISGASCEVHYSAAKAGLIGFTKALAKELGPSNIRVNCVAPGLIDTDMNNTLSDDDKAALINETPLCRIGTVSDVAKACFFLASDDASFITGQVLGVDGGFIL